MKISVKDRVMAQFALEVADGASASQAKEATENAIARWRLPRADARAARKLLDTAPAEMDKQKANQILASFQKKYGLPPNAVRDRVAAGFATTFTDVMSTPAGAQIMQMLDPASRGNLRDALNPPRFDHLTRESLIAMNERLDPDLGDRKRFRTQNEWKMTPEHALDTIIDHAKAEETLAGQAASLLYDLFDAQVFNDANHRTGIAAAGEHLIANGRDLRPGAVTVLHDQLDTIHEDEGPSRATAVASLTGTIQRLMKNGTRSPEHAQDRRERLQAELDEMPNRLRLFSEMDGFQTSPSRGKYTVHPDEVDDYKSKFTPDQRRMYEKHRNGQL